MQSVSGRFLANLAGARWVTRVQWSRGWGEPWQPATFVDGDVEGDTGQQPRWSGQVTLTDVEYGRTGLHALGCLAKVDVGMVHGPGDIEWVSKGVYRVDTTSRVLGQQGQFIQCTDLRSLEQQVMDSTFQIARQFRAEAGSARVTRLIQEVLPGATVAWRVQDVNLTRTTVESDRWGHIDGGRSDGSIAQAAGATVFCDAAGAFVVAAPSTTQDPLVWTADTGPDGLLETLTETFSRQGVYNAVTARQTTNDSTPTAGPGVAVDREPGSLTALGSAFAPGYPIWLHYTSPQLTTLVQCQSAAQRLLAPVLGLKRSITCTTGPNYALDPGDPIGARMPDGSVDATVAAHIAYTLPGPTSAPSLNIDALMTTSRLAGDVGEVPEVDQDTEVTA